jgi:carboxyl-terminal processing protease
MTRALLAGLLTAVVWAAYAVSPAAAAEPKNQSYLVLVGISDYADPQIKAKPHAEDDAKALYDLFTDPRYKVEGEQHVRLLLGKPDEQRKSQPATRANILEAVRWAVKEARRDDRVILVFFGQGAPNANRVCYFASDSTFKGRAKDAVAAGDLELELKKLKSHRFAAFLDVNFKGFQGEKVADPARAKLYEEFLGQDDDEENPLVGRVLFLANDGLSPTQTYKEHGLFAHVLLRGLKGAADKEGYEPDGTVYVDELAEYLSKQLPALARKNADDKGDENQLPHVLRASVSNFALSRNPEAAEAVTKRVAKLGELAREQKLAKPLAEEGEALLGRMPKLKAKQELRKTYARLADGKLGVDEFVKARAEIVASAKLPRSQARDFASKVIQATQVLREGYVRDVKQGELVDNAVRGLYRRLEEEIPSDLKDRLAKAKTMSESELTNLLADSRERLGKREDLANHRDLDITLQRMTRELDPYTTYIDPDTLQRFQQETSGRFTGIGVQINQPSADVLQVVTPLKGSPAYKAGIKAGDVITQVIREVDAKGRPLPKPEVINLKGLSLNEAVKKIQGEPGTKIKLVVEREGAGSLEIEVKRDWIDVETVLGYRRNTSDDEWDYTIDPENKICYVRLTSFAKNTARDLTRLVKSLDKKGVRGLVLDLRFNPGGLLTSAVEISDLFIDDGLIVSIRPRVGRESHYTGEHRDSYLNFPMVCLVNGLSASGSEIVAACLQDHHRAIIMGERSYGKGSVQNIQPFEGGELKMTTASYWRPSGKNINRTKTSKEGEDWGVMPDKGYLIPLEGRERDQLLKHMHDSEIIARHDAPVKDKEVKPEFKDRQLERALEYLRGQIRVTATAPARKAG